MPFLTLKICIKMKNAKEVVGALSVDDKIGKPSILIKSYFDEQGFYYEISSEEIDVGAIKNTFNDMLICLRPLLDFCTEK